MLPSSDREPTQLSAVPALTVVSHPDLSRVGERALLHELIPGGEVGVSRAEPSFAQPGKVWGRGLDDVYLSRRPFLLRSTQGGSILLEQGASSTGIRVRGEPLDGSCELSSETCKDGVDLELGGRIVLLLHLVNRSSGTDKRQYGLVGDSDAIAQTRAAIGRVADLHVPVLLRGESGTGKELVAQAIHQSGPRHNAPFVGVNLSAIPPSLAAAELFGSVKGAYTGAVNAQKGYFREADGGTLFLDEVGECPPEVQTMMLRAIETSEVFRVGSQTPQRVDVRLVAATDSDLEARIATGAFKEPLLHRLSAYELWLAPLRERPDDIGRLIVHFAGNAMRDLGEELPKECQTPWIPANLAGRLTRYYWPGNVRQLRNLVGQLVIDSRGQSQLMSNARLDRLLASDASTRGFPHSAGAPTESVARRRPAEIKDAELVVAMQENRWELAAAARQLGISRPSLYELIRRSDRVSTAEDLDVEEIKQSIARCQGDVDAAASELEVSVRGLRRRLGRLKLE